VHELLRHGSAGADVLIRTGLADRYIKFNNQVCEFVAREFPKKIIVFLNVRIAG